MKTKKRGIKVRNVIVRDMILHMKGGKMNDRRNKRPKDQRRKEWLTDE